MLCQNAHFYHEELQEDRSCHPAGQRIAEMLRESLAERGWNVSQLLNWRDSGWNFVCKRDGIEVNVILAQMATTSHWLLQISPEYVPGAVGWLMGKKRSASDVNVYEAAKQIHQTISAHGGFTMIEWCWDGIPTEANGSAAPGPP
jgi:hypothetical protein